MAKQSIPYGLWPSSIAPADVAAGARRFGLVQGDGPWIYWTEGRPAEKGRQTLLRAKPGAKSKPQDLLAAPWSARSRVHEYGGGEFLAAGDVVYFVNDADQDVYELSPGGEPTRLTNEPAMRFADFALDRPRRRLICVAERYAKGRHNPDNLLVAIALEGANRGHVTELATGRDFYAWPRLSPDGKCLAFLGWDLPDMPWDRAALFVCGVGADGGLDRPRRIAGGDGSAAMQPAWLADGRLVFLADGLGQGNLALWDGGAVRWLSRFSFDLGAPMWTLGVRSLVVARDGGVCAVDAHGISINLFSDVNADPATSVQSTIGAKDFGSLAAFDGGIAGIAGFAKAPAAIAALDDRNRPTIIVRTGADLALDPRGLSISKLVTFAGGDGKETFAHYYTPTNAAARAPAGALPPTLVLAHGGPTSKSNAGLSLRIQFYSSRGFAVLDVDYAGSTGYGRAYRERLEGQWGIADVADCAAAARYLAAKGLADPTRIAIAGGSAGGYTVLMALATTTAFAAGSSHYGISDLSLLMQHTHKFESGYLHRLLGTTPKAWKTVCKARSPITLIDGITAPLMLFQGLDDKVVPPEQSRLIADKLRARGQTVELHEFAGEGHGFRRAETIIAVLEAELAFLLAAMGIAPAPAAAMITAAKQRRTP